MEKVRSAIQKVARDQWQLLTLRPVPKGSCFLFFSSPRSDPSQASSVEMTMEPRAVHCVANCTKEYPDPSLLLVVSSSSNHASGGAAETLGGAAGHSANARKSKSNENPKSPSTIIVFDSRRPRGAVGNSLHCGLALALILHVAWLTFGAKGPMKRRTAIMETNETRRERQDDKTATEPQFSASQTSRKSRDRHPAIRIARFQNPASSCPQAKVTWPGLPPTGRRHGTERWHRDLAW
ncbi:hypothetical protein TgHK011_003781 [Trichoderma gracile]|nr:hypothetical protein TgHK011_003781 [Trichoderma gracile]